MIFTRKHIVIAVLFAVVGIAIGIGIKHYETLQTFSSSDIKVVLDLSLIHIYHIDRRRIFVYKR